MLKATLRNDWENAVEEIIEDEEEVHNKTNFRRMNENISQRDITY